MTHPRVGATGTLLPNGQVLIAGGDDYAGRDVSEHLASAELYDPATRTFAPTGSMKSARSFADAVLLSNGKVLIMGGDGCQVPARCTLKKWAGAIPLSSAEIYDPATGRFTPAGSMVKPNDNPLATLLPDGRVLVFGINDETLVEAYDPTTGRFSKAGTLAKQYGTLDVALLPSGKLLVVGDDLSGLGAELFDPGTGRSSPIPFSIPAAPSETQLWGIVPLPDGRILVDAFDNVGTGGNYFYIYDPGTGALVPAAPFDGPVGWIPARYVLQRDGRVLLLLSDGYIHDQYLGDSSTELVGLYDPSSGLRMLDCKPVELRDVATMTTLPDGSVLIAGGERLPEALFSAELFVP